MQQLIQCQQMTQLLAESPVITAVLHVQQSSAHFVNYIYLLTYLTTR